MIFINFETFCRIHTSTYKPENKIAFRFFICNKNEDIMSLKFKFKLRKLL